MAVVIVSLCTGIVLIARDDLRQARLSELRAAFVGGVSHGFRTPLTAIRMYADMLRYKGSFSDEERRRFYETIAGEAERLNQLVDRVLEVSRIDRGQRQYRFSSDDLAGTVNRIIEAYKEYYQRQGYELNAGLEYDIPALQHDPQAVSEAILNLLDNAVKFSDAGKQIDVILRSDGDDVIFQVRDYGAGIAPAEQGKIFDEFYRGAAAASKGGYGIGLYLVRHIMMAHQGIVEVESQPGLGSAFRLKFPLCPKS